MKWLESQVRVLEYLDRPGDRTAPHRHPDSMMVTLSTFTRRISAGGREVEVELPAGHARWVAAQEHAGENIGAGQAHSIFVELRVVRSGCTQQTSALAAVAAQATMPGSRDAGADVQLYTCWPVTSKR